MFNNNGNMFNLGTTAPFGQPNAYGNMQGPQIPNNGYFQGQPTMGFPMAQPQQQPYGFNNPQQPMAMNIPGQFPMGTIGTGYMGGMVPPQQQIDPNVQRLFQQCVNKIRYILVTPGKCNNNTNFQAFMSMTFSNNQPAFSQFVATSIIPHIQATFGNKIYESKVSDVDFEREIDRCLGRFMTDNYQQYQRWLTSMVQNQQMTQQQHDNQLNQQSMLQQQCGSLGSSLTGMPPQQQTMFGGIVPPQMNNGNMNPNANGNVFSIQPVAEQSAVSFFDGVVTTKPQTHNHNVQQQTHQNPPQQQDYTPPKRTRSIEELQEVKRSHELFGSPYDLSVIEEAMLRDYEEATGANYLKAIHDEYDHTKETPKDDPMVTYQNGPTLWTCPRSQVPPGVDYKLAKPMSINPTQNAQVNQPKNVGEINFGIADKPERPTMLTDIEKFSQNHSCSLVQNFKSPATMYPTVNGKIQIPERANINQAVEEYAWRYQPKDGKHIYNTECSLPEVRIYGSTSATSQAELDGSIKDNFTSISEEESYLNNMRYTIGQTRYVVEALSIPHNLYKAFCDNMLTLFNETQTSEDYPAILNGVIEVMETLNKKHYDCINNYLGKYIYNTVLYKNLRSTTDRRILKIMKLDEIVKFLSDPHSYTDDDIYLDNISPVWNTYAMRVTIRKLGELMGNKHHVVSSDNEEWIFKCPNLRFTNNEYQDVIKLLLEANTPEDRKELIKYALAEKTVVARQKNICFTNMYEFKSDLGITELREDKAPSDDQRLTLIKNMSFISLNDKSVKQTKDLYDDEEDDNNEVEKDMDNITIKPNVDDFDEIYIRDSNGVVSKFQVWYPVDYLFAEQICICADKSTTID